MVFPFLLPWNAKQEDVSEFWNTELFTVDSETSVNKLNWNWRRGTHLSSAILSAKQVSTYSWSCVALWEGRRAKIEIQWKWRGVIYIWQSISPLQNIYLTHRPTRRGSRDNCLGAQKMKLWVFHKMSFWYKRAGPFKSRRKWSFLSVRYTSLVISQFIPLASR